MLHWNFSEPKNPRFIIESGFKSRAGNNGARTVYGIIQNLQTSPISQISFFVETFFAASYSKTALVGI